MTVFTYSISASSTTDAPTVQRLLGSSSGTSALNLASEGLVEAVSTKPRRLSLSETRKMPSVVLNICQCRDLLIIVIKPPES
ncbi:hypothetical protein HAX54_035733 [Datura stramonium]|uniref:Uncharacterized protein n=1 Tax=Datura stramonium TaxID=4076 RepID=A0ABS8VJ15_DATST|nr:hypothetical protein [Datura stramonium]